MALNFSGRHPILKSLDWYRELAQQKGRRSTGTFLLEGTRSIAQVASVSPDALIEILAIEGSDVKQFERWPVRFVTASQFKKISLWNTSPGPLAVVQLPDGCYDDVLPEELSGNILALDGIQDPGNVGTLIRTAAAFDCAGVILSDTCADAFSPKSVSSTTGSLLSLWIRRTGTLATLLQSLKQRNYMVVAADQAGQARIDLAKEGQWALVVGSEGNGLSAAVRDVVDCRLAIPMNLEAVESLNAAVSGSLCMYSLIRFQNNL